MARARYRSPGNSPHIENGGLKGRLQARLPAAQTAKRQKLANTSPSARHGAKILILISDVF
jgi:hypothetical protein